MPDCPAFPTPAPTAKSLALLRPTVVLCGCRSRGANRIVLASLISTPPMATKIESWSLEIKPENNWWNLNLRDVWLYRDLLWLFVRRDFVSVYKQTILGPLWFFIQPVLTTLMFTAVFSGVAGISTGGLPPMLFYLAGTTPWNYFAACVTKTSGTFIQNANLFGKVYFPRLIAPLSIIVSTLIQFGIQLLLLFAFMAWFAITGVDFAPDWLLIAFLAPFLVLLMAILGLASGIIVSSLTTKYRDFTFLITFGVQLAMYATPIIYPLSSVPGKYRWLVESNPMSAIIESFRVVFLGGEVPWVSLGVSTLISIMMLAVGVVIFNKVEKSFMDTV